MSEPGGSANSREDARAWIVTWAGLAVVTILAIHRLRDFPARLSWSAAFEGARTVIGATAWAAAKVWIFWAWTGAVLAGFALTLDPELDLMDAALVGATGLWVVGYLLGNLFGPIGLYSAAMLWLLLAIGSAWLWLYPPPIRFRPLSSGEKLTTLAVALLAVSMLPLQLASPVPPFMDVLNIPSSVQQLLTFHVYLPFHDNPYGVFGVYNRAPALELFYATLALGSHTPLAVLTETAAMLPMSALLMFCTWRLGKTLFGDTAGGIAALLLFFTCLPLRMQGMRPTAAAFVLVAIALALFLDRGRRRSLMAFGAIFLGTSVASHAIDGALAFAVAGFGIILWMVEGDWSRVWAGVAAYAGALLIAATDFPIALEFPLPYPALTLMIVAGIGVIAAGVHLLRAAPETRNGAALRTVNIAMIAGFIFAALVRHASSQGKLFERISNNLPMLTLFCFGGLLASIGVLWTEDSRAMPCAGLAAIALLIALGGEYLNLIGDALSLRAVAANMASDTVWKLLDYGAPFFMIFPAAFLFALAYERWSRPITFFALMTILIYPWQQVQNPADYESAEHSIAEHWAFNLNDAAQGYWAGHSDRRWTFNPAEVALIAVLEQEIAAGRITPSTHILHLSDNVSSWGLTQFSIVTGINDDPIVLDQSAKREGWLSGSRVRRIQEMAQALAGQPGYILEQVPPPPWLRLPPDGYEQIFHRDNLRLFRRRGLNRPDGRL